MSLHVYLTPLNIFLLGILLYLSKLIYRVTLHPLAKFPGPRLAALTNLYTIRHDTSADDSVVKHLKDLHDRYGPIVRVRPDELHIFDWDAHHEVFKHNSGFDRAPDVYDLPFIAGSLLTVLNAREARPHRELYVNAFSKASVSELEPLIHEKLSAFLDRLRNIAIQDQSVNLKLAFSCLTADVTMHYCYQMSLGLIETENFQPKLITDFLDFAPMAPILWYFPNFAKVMNFMIWKVLPDRFVQAAFPSAASMKSMMQQCQSMLHSLLLAPPDSSEVQMSMFRKALNPDKEKGQYVASNQILAADSVLMFLAGTDTTSTALQMGTYGLMSEPKLWEHLRAELTEVMPDTTTMPPLRALEALPFLRAVVKESLRMSMGTSGRLPRFVPESGTMLCGQAIPPGSRVSFSHYVYNYDPTIFSRPHSFNPDRWMVSKTESDFLDNHMLSFSRGNRMCLGMNLAYAELYNTFAHIVRKFDVINDGTTEHDMDWFDSFTPCFKGSLKVKLRAAEK